MSGQIKLSVAVPYKQRLENLKIVLEGLASQTMPASDFEVVIGAMEYCGDYVDACRSFTDRLDIVSVLSARPFEIPHARNLAMRQARGQVIVQMDADTLLPPTALQRLWDRNFAYGQNVCVVGQVLGYGNNQDGDVEHVEALPYSHYRQVIEELESCAREPKDPRFLVDHVIPWAFAWTGLIAVPAATVRRHDLYFDEDFHGWGADDLDWGFRICASGTPIVLRPDVFALHLPHERNAAANGLTERVNYRRILRKWPQPDVELANAFGDFDANSLYLRYTEELAGVRGDGAQLGTVHGRVNGREVVVMGVPLDASGQPGDNVTVFDHGCAIEALPLAGLALPFDDNAFDECRVLAPLSRFSAPFWNAVCAEAKRVAKTVVLPDKRR